MAEIPSGRWTCVTELFDGPMAFLEWTVDEGPYRIRDGADSYLVEGGEMRMQTIHYTVEDEHGRVLIRADGTRTTPDRPAPPSVRLARAGVLALRREPRHLRLGHLFLGLALRPLLLDRLGRLLGAVRVVR
jgi:hypothetical protein